MEVFLNVILASGGVLTGLVICLIILMVLLPIYAASGIFVNKPKGLKKSGVHFFTKLTPGEVKIIVRGDKPVRMVMNNSSKKFKRSGTKDDPSHWELENIQDTTADSNDTGDSTESEDPTSDSHPLIRWWAKLVYTATGAVFTGIYPFQRVYEYEIERTTINRDEEGRPETEKTDSNLVLNVKRDISDHFRTRQFLFPVRVASAETKDKIPLDIIGVAEMEVQNPHKAAFGTDRWDHAVINLVTDAIITKVKQMDLDKVLSSDNETEARSISEAVEGIDKYGFEVCGVNILKFRILEINPVLDEAGLKAIQAAALAIQQAKATITDGQARADALRSINKANEEGGQHAVATMEAEMLVRAAKAAGAGGGNVILTPNNGSRSIVDPMQAAILAELQKLNHVNNQRRN